MKNTLSIIIPVYNEQDTILAIIDKVTKVKLKGWKKQIIVVNDGSTDNTKKQLQSVKRSSIIIINLPDNHGKGYAIRKGLERATGETILIQDADLEYDPSDYPDLLKPIEEDRADVVYGSRFMLGKPHRTLYYWHYVANKAITTLSNILTDLNLSDIETGYKVFNSKVLKKIKLQEKGFGFEPEVTAKIAKIPGVRIYEVGISYHGRTYDEGKKIIWRDGLRAIWCIIKYNLL